MSNLNGGHSVQENQPAGSQEAQPQMKSLMRIITPDKVVLPDEGERFLNSKQMAVLYRKTPKNYIKNRPAKGGGEWKYVDGFYVKKTLNYIFGFDWDFEVKTSLTEAWEIAKLTKELVIVGRLTMRHNGKEIFKEQAGSAKIKFKNEPAKSETGQILYENKMINGQERRVPKMIPTNEPLDFGNDVKAAITDATKKCASELGIAADVYSDDWIEIKIAEPEEQTDTKKVVSENMDALADAKLKELEEADEEDLKDE